MLANAHAVHTQRWARAMSARGHAVTVISIRAADIPGVTVLRRSLGNVGASKLAALLSYVLLLVRLPFDLRRIRPDVVNPHYCITHGTIAALAGARPRIVNVWGSDLIWSGEGEMPRWRKALIRYALRRADAIVSTSRFMAEAIEKLMPDHPPITLVPFGVDTIRFKPAEPKRAAASLRVGFVKSFSGKYAPEIFIEAAATVARNRDDIEFAMAGRGPLLDKMRQLAAECGIAARIDFPGFIAHDDVAGFMRKLDILVNCSRAESFGVVICEASACGLPVIATDVGGVRETLLDGETGILIPVDSADALAAAILTLAGEAKLRARMGAAGRRFICEHYEWDLCVEKLDQLMHAHAPIFNRFPRGRG